MHLLLIKKTTLLFIIFILAAAGTFTPLRLQAADGAEFELIVRQKPSIDNEYHVIRRDTIGVLSGQLKNIFLVNMSLDIKVERADTQTVEFDAYLNTIGQTPYNYAQKYRVEYNLPARLEDIPGKNGTVYQLLISPRKYIDIDKDICPFDINSENDFKTVPSANFDFYLVPNSLADFDWNAIKGYLEADYMQFRNVLDISFSNKISYYLSPCMLNAVDWDSRFGYAIDPGRTRIFALYSHNFKSSEAILTNMLLLLRQWGYAPPFISEGLAGYFEFNIYDAKNIIKTSATPSLENMMTPSGYYAVLPSTADAVSGSFIKYLADSYGIGKIKEWYDKSDDLNLARNLTAIYGQTIDSLQNGWLHYIDTVTISRELFDYFASRAGALKNSDKQIEYYENMLRLDDSKQDSIDTRKKLYMIYYQVGRYYDAEKGYRELNEIDSARSIYWQIVGNLDMINDELTKAWDAFDSAYAVDSTYVSAKLLQAEILYDKGQIEPAIEMVEKYYEFETSITAKIEFLLLMGKLYEARHQKGDLQKAQKSYNDALAWCKEMIPKYPNDPAFKYRAGLAYMGLKMYKEANDFLELAWFTENRAYFLGDILLERGKVNDLLGNREAAIGFYQECLASRAAAKHHEESRRYIDKPYSK